MHLCQFCYLGALIHYDNIVSGVVMEINREECFCIGWAVAPIWMENLSKCHQPITLKDSLLAAGFSVLWFQTNRPIFGYFGRNWCKIVVCTVWVQQLWTWLTRLVDVLRLSRIQSQTMGCSNRDAHCSRNCGGDLSDYKGGDDFIFGRELTNCRMRLRFIIKEVIQNAQIAKWIEDMWIWIWKWVNQKISKYLFLTQKLIHLNPSHNGKYHYNT